MKNDIDEILSSVFGKAGQSGKSRAAEDAEAFLKSISGGENSISRSLQKQIDNLDSANELARADLDAVAKQLEKDGFKPQQEEHKKATGSETASKDMNVSFAKAEEKTKTEVIGQDDFLRKLLISFKRPLVMGAEAGRPLSTIIITGKLGTGRHSALNSVAQELNTQGILESPGVALIDLALYGSGEDSKLFVQDLYAATQQKGAVILFENYDKCHKSLLPMLTDLVLTGKAQLGSRYALQKDMLIEVGTALVPNAISALSCAGKYLVFITTNNQGRIADVMGAAFINGVGDICMTSAFSPESLDLIGEKELRGLCEKTRDRLGFTVFYDEKATACFASKFTLSDGVNAITAFSAKCFKMLSEYKLNSLVERSTCRLKVQAGGIQFCFDAHTVDVPDAVPDNGATDEVRAQMAEIVGLRTVKDYIFSLEENYKVQQLRKQRGMRADPPSMHMIFTGNPGTGKTTIARLVSRYLKSIGVLTGGQLIEVTRADLVGRFVGHTAPLTRQVIESAIGGVLFIDEAYSLYRSDDDTFGLECIDTLVKGMEDNRENLLVILAGYSKEMEEFLKSNSGLVSRFPNVIEFPDYTAEELLEISALTAKNKGYIICEECMEPLKGYYVEKQSENSRTGGNGRMVRNLIENAILNQSKRIIAENCENYEEILRRDFAL